MHAARHDKHHILSLQRQGLQATVVDMRRGMEEARRVLKDRAALQGGGDDPLELVTAFNALDASLKGFLHKEYPLAPHCSGRLEVLNLLVLLVQTCRD